MTDEEAVTGIKTWIGFMKRHHKDNDFAMEFIECAWHLAKKQMPREPIIDDPLNDEPKIYYKCPSCGAVHNRIDNPYISFCPCCGQALKED